MTMDRREVIAGLSAAVAALIVPVPMAVDAGEVVASACPTATALIDAGVLSVAEASDRIKQWTRPPRTTGRENAQFDAERLKRLFPKYYGT